MLPKVMDMFPKHLEVQMFVFGDFEFHKNHGFGSQMDIYGSALEHIMTGIANGSRSFLQPSDPRKGHGMTTNQ